MSGGRGDDGPGEDGLARLPGIERQAGAIAWLPGSDPLRFVLVTSRRTRRWIFPKGVIEPGLSGPATAAREALEEAGVAGLVDDAPVGRFRGRKVRPPNTWAVEVEIYPLRIEEVREHWPEEAERARSFVTLSDARALLTDPAMLDIAERFAAGR